MPTASALGSDQSPEVIGVPAGVNQLSSAVCAPVRNRCRRKTGWERRNATRSAVNDSRPESTADQSYQEISLSWQYALLLPPWVRPSSSPPNGSSKVVSMARACRARKASTSGSGVGPSAPQFQDRLSLVPSRFASPLA